MTMNTTFENKNQTRPAPGGGTRPTTVDNRGRAARAPGDNAATRLSNQIDSLKRQIFSEFKDALGENQQLLRLALFEADILARQTGFPQLLFPELALEKAQNAARWQFRQQYLLRSNSPYALAA
jgi:hypothetical protein